MRRTAACLPPLAFLALALAAFEPRARACGCIAPPDVVTPTVQAGERIVFAASNGTVEAHIQVSFDGARSGGEFGWLIPLPSMPTLELGTEELFNALGKKTQLEFVLTKQDVCAKVPAAARSSAGCGCDEFSGGYYGEGWSGPRDGGGFQDIAGRPNPVTVAGAVGPFDYAVLKADDPTAVRDWLKTNRFFVPAGTDAALTRYLHPGAFILALRLDPTAIAGEIQPLVVRYASDLPMIPITLTSVGATPGMPITVWVLGPARAIPRNYYHLVLNDALLDWSNRANNYLAVLRRAAAEAPGKHGFSTEYAGPSAIMEDVLDPPGRFGDTNVLATIKDPVKYVVYLRDHGYPLDVNNLRAILFRYIPMPIALSMMNVTSEDFYRRIDYWLGEWRNAHPGVLPDWYPRAIDPVAVTADITARVIAPTLAAARLFSDHKQLTRLFTTLDPADMTVDPVFSFNPDLPNVPLRREAKLAIGCGDGTLHTPAGLSVPYPDGDTPPKLPTMPAALRIETLREAGPPEIVTDNQSAIVTALGGMAGGNKDGGDSDGGISLAPKRRGTDRGLAVLLTPMLFGLLRLSRRRRAH